MNKVLFILLFILVCSNSGAQEENISDIISSIAEDLADDETDPEAVSSFVEKLYDLHEKPVRINSADETELARLFFLTDFQVKALRDYIGASGIIYSLYEIANIPGFDREIAMMISPFISLDARKANNQDSIRLKNSLLANFSVRYPVPGDPAAGSAWKIVTRYKFSAGGISGGLTSEKDSGEKLLAGNPPLPDFLSANLAWTGKGVVKKLIIGDFAARFGMGTGINTSLRTGLLLTQTGYLSGGDEIKPYTSTDENIFFRGIASQIQIKNTGLSLFCSANRIDAKIDTSDIDTERFIDSFYRSGLHNTGSAAVKKDAVTEYCYGVNIVSDFNKISFGLLWTGSRFSLPVKILDPDPEDFWDFQGNKNSVASAYYKGSLGKMVFYGEVASNLNGKLAFIQGLSFRPADRLVLNLLYRNYHPGFTSFHGKGLFSGSAGDNVKGLFGNFTFEAARHLFLIAGCDLRYFPWLKYRCSAPSMAVKKEVRIKYLPSDRTTAEAAYSYYQSVLNNQATTGIKKQDILVNHLFKGIFRYSPDKYLTFVTRVDYKITRPDGGRGMLLLQDINYRFKKIPLSLWFRYCIFKTDDWETRLYTYENDLIYNFSIPALSGEGSRSYLMVAWEPFKFADLRIKYACTGLIRDRIAVNETKELKIQVRMWF